MGENNEIANKNDNKSLYEKWWFWAVFFWESV